MPEKRDRPNPDRNWGKKSRKKKRDQGIQPFRFELGQQTPFGGEIIIIGDGGAEIISQLVKYYGSPSLSTPNLHYPRPEQKQTIVTIGKTFAEYAHQQQIGVLVYPDIAARLLDKAVSAYWEQKYPGERMPERYFVNPQAAASKEQVIESINRRLGMFKTNEQRQKNPPSVQADTLTPSSIFNALASAVELEKVLPQTAIEDVMQLAEQQQGASEMPFNMRLARYLLERGVSIPEIMLIITSEVSSLLQNYIEYSQKEFKAFTQARPSTEVLEEFQQTYTGLMKDTKRKVLIVDTCVHKGDVAIPLIDNLHTLGFADVRLGVTSSHTNVSGMNPDVSVREEVQSGSACYPLWRDTLVDKQPDSIVSHRVMDGEERRIGSERRREIKQIITSHFPRRK